MAYKRYIAWAILCWASASLLSCAALPGLALTLNGYICNEHGRIGILINSGGCIRYVFRHSPAYQAQLQEQDMIVSADGVEGIQHIDGDSGTTAHLVVQRGQTVFHVDIKRVPDREVHD